MTQKQDIKKDVRKITKEIIKREREGVVIISYKDNNKIRTASLLNGRIKEFTSQIKDHLRQRIDRTKKMISS